MIPHGLRGALGLLTVAPVSTGRLDRRAAGRAIAWAPVVGVLLGIAAAAVLVAAERLAQLGPLLAAVLAVAALALLTRGLHLDGLADLADGLGSGRPPAEALRVMRSPDIGAFGVVSVVFVVLVDVAALARATEAGHGPAAVLAAAVTGRLAVAWACRSGVPAARDTGLGALVAGSVRWPVPALLTAATLAVAVAYAAAAAVAVAAGLVAAEGVRHHAVRRLGGVTGDVLGAVVETATAVTLVVMAARPLG